MLDNFDGFLGRLPPPCRQLGVTVCVAFCLIPKKKREIVVLPCPLQEFQITVTWVRCSTTHCYQRVQHFPVSEYWAWDPLPRTPLGQKAPGDLLITAFVLDNFDGFLGRLPPPCRQLGVTVCVAFCLIPKKKREIVVLPCPLQEFQITVTWVRCSTTHCYQRVQHFPVSEYCYGCQCLGFVTHAQMLMHAIAPGGCTDTVRQSALEADWEKNAALGT